MSRKNVHFKAFVYSIRSNYMLAFCCIIFSALIGLLPALEVQLVKQIVAHNQTSYLQYSLIPLIALCGITVGSSALDFMLASCQAIFGHALEYSSYRDFFSSLATMSTRQLNASEVALKISLTQDALTEQIIASNFQVFVQILSISSTLISLSVILAGISASCIVLLLAIVIPLAVASGLYAHQKDLGSIALAKIHRRQDYLQRILLSKQSAAELSLLSATGFFIGELQRLNKKEEKIRLSYTTKAVAAIIVAAIISTVACIALFELITNLSSYDYLIAIATGLLSGISSVCACAATLAETQNSNTALFCFFDTIENAYKHDYKRQESPVELNVKNVTYTYPNTNKGLSGININAHLGEVIAFVGANGAGKTTLSKILMGIIKPDEGLVDYGVDTQKVPVSAVLQNFIHFELTVKDYLCLGKEHSDSEVWAALEAVDIASTIRTYDDGLDTQLGERWGGINLSGGQWQKLAIARSLLKNSCLRVYDEATAHIDSAFEEVIYKGLAESAENNITILVSHRAWTLSVADVIYVLDDGKIIEQGTLESLLVDDTKFKQLFSSQLTSD